MEQNFNAEARTETEVKRDYVAAWIQNVLRPVDRLMKYDDLFPDDSSKIEHTASQFEVREYQLDAWSAIWAARQDGKSHGLVHLATGLGKTSVAVFDVMKFREEFHVKHGRDPKVMFAVHQNDILEQAADRFRTFIPDASVGYYNGSEKSLDNDITFATFQSLRSNIDSLDPKTFDYIIDDEVHHAKAHTYEKVIKHFKPAFRLGLTATPDRADEKDIREIYGQELYSMGLPEALAEGWLATPDYHIVFDDAVKSAAQSGFEANSLKALRELFDVQPRNDTIADNIREEMEKLGLEFNSVKTIVFCQDIAHADEMAALLGGKAYHSETDSKESRDIFNEFKSGDLQVITTRDMFNEGVDVPEARLLVFLRSTSSQTIFEQQLGRGLRKTKEKQRVTVLDFVANIERIAMVKELADKIKMPRSRGELESHIDNPSSDESDFEHAKDGLLIHTNHGDFDFSKMTIDLLERYRWLMVDSLAPDGYLTMTPIAEALGIPTTQFSKIANSLGLVGVRLRSKYNEGVYYSPEEQALIAEVASSYEIADNAHLSVRQIGKKLSLADITVRRIASELEIEPTLCRRGNGRLDYLYTPAQIERIAQCAARYPRVESGYVSIEPLARGLDVGPKTIQTAAESLGIVGTMMRPKSGRATTFYSPDEQRQIANFVTSLDTRYAPEEYATIGKLAKDSGWSYRMVANAASRLGITGEKMPVKSAGGVTSTVFSSEEQSSILSELNKYPRATDGYVPIVPLSKKIGASKGTVSNAARDLGISGQMMQGKSSVGVFYSPEEQVAIEKYFEEKRKKNK